MTDNSRRRRNVWTPFIFFAALVTGILLGYFISSQNSKSNVFRVLVERNDPLREIITLINDQYVDSVSSDSLYEDAVTGILKHLDPHTIYIPARELGSVNENLEGSFKGIGIEFYKLNDTIQVVSVIHQGPSEKAGIQAGDQIIKINDTLVSGVKMSSDALIKKLRGTAKSTVKLSLQRGSDEKLITVDVVRDAIPLYSVDAAYMLDATTGYIKINRFSATTYDEFKKAGNTLKKAGMQQMVLDLRQNPGGYMEAAVAIADEFLNDGKMVTYTQGRKFEKEEYDANRPGALENSRLVVLIDEGSASASEIIAGAMQDWDRAVIMGRQSFGKGLVQQQFELSDGSALRLTTARYYTPTGRSIQRSYAQGRDAYAHDYYKRLYDTSGTDSALADTTVYFSQKSHRKLYGSGGITPDIIVPADAIFQSSALEFLFSTSVLSNYVYHYFNQHRQELKQYRNFEDFDQNFIFTPQMTEELRQAFVLENAAHTKTVWQQPAALAFLKNQAKAMLAKMLFDPGDFYRVTNERDSLLKRAVEVIHSPEYQQILQGNPS